MHARSWVKAGALAAALVLLLTHGAVGEDIATVAAEVGEGTEGTHATEAGAATTPAPIRIPVQVVAGSALGNLPRQVITVESGGIGESGNSAQHPQVEPEIPPEHPLRNEEIIDVGNPNDPVVVEEEVLEEMEDGRLKPPPGAAVGPSVIPPPRNRPRGLVWRPRSAGEQDCKQLTSTACRALCGNKANANLAECSGFCAEPDNQGQSFCKEQADLRSKKLMVVYIVLGAILAICALALALHFVLKGRKKKEAEAAAAAAAAGAPTAATA